MVSRDVQEAGKYLFNARGRKLTHQYITGLGRGNEDYGLAEETHIYVAENGRALRPLCNRGWNRDFGTRFSIFRENIGDAGICPVCEARETRGHSGIGVRKLPRKLKKKIYKLLESHKYSPLQPGLPLSRGWSSPFAEGCKAAQIQNKWGDAAVNPYPKGSRKADEWQEGWENRIEYRYPILSPQEPAS